MIIAQISDTHISDDDDKASHLQRAVAYLLRLPAQPNVVLITGDCVNNGTASQYARFQSLIRPLTMPVYVIPGNHDDRVAMQTSFGDQGNISLPGFVQYVVDEWPVRLIALDTNVPGHNEGFLGAERLEWLEKRLAEAPTRPTVVFMHHPPFRTGLAVIDGMGLVDVEAFGAVIARHPQVERIVAGHVHMAITQRFRGTLAMTCGSTAEQMLPDLHTPERLAVVMEPPTCLLHVWSASTGIVTYTSIIDDYGPAIEIHDGVQWVG